MLPCRDVYWIVTRSIAHPKEAMISPVRNGTAALCIMYPDWRLMPDVCSVGL